MSDTVEEKVNIVSKPLAQFGFAVLTLVMIGVNVYQNTQFTETIKDSNVINTQHSVAIQKLTDAIEHMNRR